MGANLGQKSTVVDGLVLCLDAGNPSSRERRLTTPTINLVNYGFAPVDSPEDTSGWQRVAASESYFVSMNSNGTNQIAYSRDGITWTSASATQDNWWFGLAYGNGKFVMTARGTVEGNAGTQIINYASESNLSSWTGVTPSQDNNWNAVAYGNGKFVAVADAGGSPTNQVMYASDNDLDTWTMASAAEANTWWGIAYGNGKFVAVSQNGTNRVMYSTDGISWTSASASSANEWTDVTFGDGYFVAVAQSGVNRIMYSSDGINWTGAAHPQAVSWRKVTYGDGYFVAVSFSSNSEGATTSNSVMWARSSDLSSWTTTDIFYQGRWGGIAFKQGRFIACSYDESTDRFARADVSNLVWNDVSTYHANHMNYSLPWLWNLEGASSSLELNMTSGDTDEYWGFVDGAGNKYDNLDRFNFAALNYSIELWINRYDGVYVFDLRQVSGDSHSYIAFSAGSSNRLVWRPWSTSSIFGDDADNPTATDETWTGWRHYVITREGTGSNECKLYYNGSHISSGTDSGTHTTPPNFKIGLRSYDNTNPFKGKLGLFKIYNDRALTATEVLDSYNNTKWRYE